MTDKELVEFSHQVRAILQSVGIPELNAIKVSVKLIEEWDGNPVAYELGTHRFELYYKDFSIAHHDAWHFEDDTKDMAFWDTDLLSGLLTCDKLREQGL